MEDIWWKRPDESCREDLRFINACRHAFRTYDGEGNLNFRAPCTKGDQGVGYGIYLLQKGNRRGTRENPDGGRSSGGPTFYQI